VDELVAIDDLHNPILVGAVAEINPVAVRAERNHAVELFRNGPARTGLLAGQAEVANFDRVRRIAHVIDFRHAIDAPARHTRDEVGDPAVAFPKAFMGIVELAVTLPNQRWFGGIRDVVDLMAFAAEYAEQIGLVGVAFGQRAAVARVSSVRRLPRNCRVCREYAPDIADAPGR